MPRSLIAITTLWIFFLLGCRKHSTETRSVELLSVKATRVKLLEGYEQSTISTGEVIAKQTSQLGFEFAGTIHKVYFDRGERVEAGELIATLDTELLENRQVICNAERDNVKSVLAELHAGSTFEVLERARADAEALVPVIDEIRLRKQRYQKLVQSGSVPQQEYEQILSEEQSLLKQFSAAMARYRELDKGPRSEKIDAQTAMLAQANAKCHENELKIKKSKLVAPYPAIISDRFFDDGAIVRPGVPVIEIVRAEQYEAQIGVPVDEVQHLREQSQHHLTIGGQPVTAKLRQVLPKIDEPTRIASVVFDIETDMRPAIGRLAQLKLTRVVNRAGIWIPVEALVAGYRGTWACYFVAPVEGIGKTSEEEFSVISEGASDSSFVVEKVAVEVQHLSEDLAFITGDFSNDELIVTRGVNRIVVGQKVMVDRTINDE